MSEKPEDREQKTENTRHSTQTASRLILLVAVVIAVCVFIIRNFDVSKNILLVLLGFGAVILIHELGHFVVAKLCGITVEALSIGMPPILFGIKKAGRGWRIRILPELLKGEGENTEDGLLGFTIGKKILPGETEYRIGLIPLGGFVKMLGQEDVGPVKENTDPRSFANKSALSRAAVLTAGVTFNVISAVIVYIIVFLIGINLPAPVVGEVIPGSPAASAGIKPGDEIIEVAGAGGRLDFSDVVMAAVLSGKEQKIPLKVKHENGTIEDYNLSAEQLPGGQIRGFGIERPFSLTIAKLLAEDANQLFKTTGLMPGDRIKTIGGVDVTSHWQLESIIEGTFEPNITILAERREHSGQPHMAEGHISLVFPVASQHSEPNLLIIPETNLANICGIVPRWRIEALGDTSKSFVPLLKRLSRKLSVGRMDNKEEFLENGDIILAAGETANPTYKDFRLAVREYKDRILPIKVLRTDVNGVEKTLDIAVKPKWSAEANDVLIGIVLSPVLDMKHAVVAKTIATERHPNAAAIPRGATITAVDGVEVRNFYDIARQLKRNSGQHVTVDWRLDTQTAGNAIVDVGEKWDVVTAYAVADPPVPFEEMQRLYKADGPVDAIGMGYRRTKTFILQTYVTLHRLIGGLVSPKQLMGPVGILTFSYKIVAAQPFVYYVYFLGLISASIAVLNFLPVPPFDGGLTVLLLVEKIKGSAISVRTQEVIAYAAWAIIIVLILYVTYNDILRLIFGFFG